MTTNHTCRRRVRRPTLLRPALGISLCLLLAACGSTGKYDGLDQGEWQIVGFVAPGVAAMAPDEAVERLGEVVVFSEQEARFGDHSCDTPGYLKRELDTSAFFEAFGSFPGQVGLVDEPVQVTEVSCGGQPFGPGGTLLRKSDTAIVVVADGIYFELAR